MVSINTKKKIIYIDQSFISNFSKADKKDLKQFKSLSELLNQAVSEEKAVCPSSWYHHEESSLVDKSFERDLKYQLGYLGQVDFKSGSEIEIRQFNSAAKRYLKVNDSQITCRNIFDKDPDKHLERWKIEANLNLSFLNIPQNRKTTGDNIDHIRREIIKLGQNFDTRLIIEQNAYREYLTQMYPDVFINVFQSQKESYQNFLDSNEMREMPKFLIYTTMWCSILTGSSSRKTQEGDWLDVQAISTYLPYTHIFTTDAFMKHHIMQNSLDKKYKVKIFSPSTSDVKEFCNEVKNIIENIPPANIPVLSVVLIPDKKMKENYWKVCQKLNNSRKIFENYKRGWVELINVDDGACPRYYHEGAKVEIDPPSFMGFDSQLTTGNNNLETKEKAITSAKSTRILLYDHFCEPSEDFIQSVMEAIEKNDLKPLGYEVILKSD